MRSSASLVRNVLATVFIGAFLVGGALFFYFQYQYAVENSRVRAQGLMAIAQSIRSYTAKQIRPLLPSSDTEFHSESIPAFAVQTIFHAVDERDHAFDYRERMLNPTNPLDRADGFETDLIQRFRADRDLHEVTGNRIEQDGTTLYVAHPIVITDAGCLACHSTPGAAPKAVTAKFGEQNGFNWPLNEPIGIQLVKIPMAAELGRSLGVFAVAFGGLALVLVVCYAAIAHLLNRNLIAPLRVLAFEADRQSRQEAAIPPPVPPRLQELAALWSAFDRLRISALLVRRSSGRPSGTGSA